MRRRATDTPSAAPTKNVMMASEYDTANPLTLA